MTSRAVWLVVALWVVGTGCGSEVTAQGGGGGGAGPGGSTGSGGSGATGSGTGSGSGTSSSSSSSGGCGGLAEAACMASYPTCAPAYADVCCSSCTPGPCADCSDYEFYQCGPLEQICSTGACWLPPDWACAGETPPCPAITDPGGEYACDQAPGCVVVACSPDVNCVETQCHPVTAASCTTACDAIPPSCPPGQVAEADGFCWTGFCMPAAVCGS